MKIKFFAPEWGNTKPFSFFAEQVKAAGYDGIEMALPFNEQEKNEILAILKENGLELIGQYWQSLEKDVEVHARNYEQYLRHLAAAKPIFINCQTGKDYFSFAQNQRLFNIADAISIETGIAIIHETHRGKSLFAAHITRDYLERIPALRITLDISHWCNVHESLLEDQEDEVNSAIQRTDHIHSRVGHPEGPQVNDPRAPEWKLILETHFAWWDKVVALHQKENRDLTITTEFGPPNYMPVMPYTQEPLANQFEVNKYMMNLLKQRYTCE